MNRNSGASAPGLGGRGSRRDHGLSEGGLSWSSRLTSDSAPLAESDREDGCVCQGPAACSPWHNPMCPVVSEQEIEAAKTPEGGWTKEQLAAWGVPWPPPKGWKRWLTNRNRRIYTGDLVKSIGRIRVVCLGAEKETSFDLAKVLGIYRDGITVAPGRWIAQSKNFSLYRGGSFLCRASDLELVEVEGARDRRPAHPVTPTARERSE